MLQQELKTKIQWRWVRRWKISPRYLRSCVIDKTLPSKNWLKLITPLSRVQASLLLQLCTSHIGLNKHLHHINKSDTSLCQSCNEHTPKTTQHFLFECHRYHQECFTLQRMLHRKATNPSYLLTNPAATIPILKYVHSTRCLKQAFGLLHVI